MGQIIGKAKIKEEALPFINLPRSLVHDLRQTIYEVAEGYGLTLQELREIIRLCLREFLRIPETNIDEYSDVLFQLFNGDESSSEGKQQHQLVDSFEVLATIGLASGMELNEKIHFIFDLFDFNETGDLNLNETTLAFRTIMSGASKLVRAGAWFIVDTDFIDRIAIEAFESLSSKNNLNLSVALVTDDERLSRKKFFSYVFNCAETNYILNHFDDICYDVVETHRNDRNILASTPLPLRFNASSEVDKINTSDKAPWRDQIQFLKPHNDEESIAVPPTTSLSINWVYGRNTQGEVLCGSDSSIIYPAGTMVVKLSNDRSEQQYFMQHSGHVTSIDILQTKDFGEVVASADIGCNSSICIWSVTNMASLVTISRFYHDGVSKIRFSPSCDLILTLGNKSNTLALHNWRTRETIFTARVPDADVYNCNFLGSDQRFGVCGGTSVHFWTRDDNCHYNYSHGVFNRLSTRELMTCLIHSEGSVLSGSTSGRLWIWEGRVCLKLIHTFPSSLTCLSENGALCASTRDGMVYLLNSEFEVTRKFNVGHSIGAPIDSIFICPGLKKILIGKGNSLYEADRNKQQELVIGQDAAKTFAQLDKTTIVSVSDRGVIMLWDTDQRKMMDRVYVGSRLSCVAYNEALDQIAIGFASFEQTEIIKKSFIIVNKQDLNTVVHSGCNAQKTLTTCKYSVNGEYLVFGSEDTAIYIHLCNEKGFPLVAKCRGHKGPISSIDFGTCNGHTFLRSNSYITGEALFWRADGKPQTPMSQRQTQWESLSCTLRWDLGSVHDDVLSASCCVLSTSSSDGQLPTVFVGDSKGKVRVFSHPAVFNTPMSLSYKGHSGKVTTITCCSKNSKTIFSMSCTDTCLIQWKCSRTEWKVDTEAMISRKAKTESLDMNDVICQLNDLNFTKKSKPERVSLKNRSMPWKLSIVPPTDFQPRTSQFPDGTLTLEKVHGYDGKARENLYAITNSTSFEVVYSVAKVLVRFNVTESKQQFFIADDKIICISLHQLTSICAVASRSGSIHIVHLDSMEMVTQIKADSACIDFDCSGRFLAVLGNRTLSVFDWKNQAVISSSENFSFDTSIKFYHSSCIVERGRDFIRFWDFNSNGGMLGFGTVFDEIDDESFCCMTVAGDNMVVGCSSGKLLKFTENVINNSRAKAHASKISCMESVANKDIVTGSSDGFVKVWTLELRCLLSINAQEIGVGQEISNVAWNDKLQIITIGTMGNEIWYVPNNRTGCSGGPIVRSHSSGGLSINGTGVGSFVTTGDDGLLRLWNVYQEECKLFDLNMPSRAVAFSPDGRMVAVGMGKPIKENARTINGKWAVMNIYDGSYQVLTERRDSRQHVFNIKWCGSRIAVACSDSRVYIYEVSSQTSPAIKVELAVLSIIELKSQAIQLDFSRDAKYIRINTSSKQLEFYEAGPGVHIQESSRLRDLTWDTETCIYCLAVQGAWSPYQDETEILSVDGNVHNNMSSLVCGDEAGCLRLYHYPCTSYDAHYTERRTHFGPVGHVRWLPGASHVISTGAHDNSIMIWKHSVGDNSAGSSSFIKHSQTNIQDTVFVPRHITGNAHQLNHAPSGKGQSVLDLVWVQGFQSNCLGRSAFYENDRHIIIYPVSNLLIVFDQKTNSQRYMHHETEVSAICLSGDRRLVASACGTALAELKVWDAPSTTEMVHFTVNGEVYFVVFSPDNTKLACISKDFNSNYIVSLFVSLSGHWVDGYQYSQNMAGNQSVYFAEWTLSDSDNHLVTGGDSHLSFWTQYQSNLISSHQYDDEVYICGLSIKRGLVTGSRGGSIIIWNDQEPSKIIEAHNGSVLALCSCPEGCVSSGSDGMAIIWCKNWNKIASFEVSNSSACPYQNAICSLDVFESLSSDTATKILLGTRSSSIYEVSCTSRVMSRVCFNHQFGDVTDACIDPNDDAKFATVGRDKSIKIWNLDGQVIDFEAVISESPLQCVDWSNTGSILVGCDTQSSERKFACYTFMVLNAADLNIIGHGKATEHSITAVKFSPDSRFFACAADNFKIYIHDNSLESNYQLISIAEKHNGIVTALDFSLDSSQFQGMSLFHEYYKFMTETGEPSDSDIDQWTTNGCLHTPNEDSESQQTCSQLSADGKLIVVGMSSGCVEITRIESDQPARRDVVTNAHCGAVAKVILSNNSKTIISIGQYDRTLRIWRVIGY